jgi:SAM-dependent methyltransferase
VSTPRFLAVRRPEVRDTSPWMPFSHVAHQLRVVITDLVRAASSDAPVRVFDHGCAERPYVDVLPPGSEYVGGDLPGNPHADVHLGDDGRFPLPDSGFDVVLSTQVLEHVRDPAVYLGECFRLLRPGGSLVCTTHGIMYYHPDPDDYWRWTRDGLRLTVEAAGFEVVELRGIMGLVPTSLQLFQEGAYWHMPRRLRSTFVLVLQAAIKLTDRRGTDDQRTMNGLVLGVRAVRPG